MTSIFSHARGHHLLFGGVVALVLFSSSMASAQQDADARMQAFIEEATEHYRNGQYADAARSFEAAYEAKNEPVLIKNAMVAWFADDQNCERAGALANKYLELTATQPSKSDPEEVAAQVKKDKRDAKTVIVKCSIKGAEKALGKLEIERDDLDVADGHIKVGYRHQPEGEDVATLETLRDRVVKERIALERKNSNGELPPTVTPAPRSSNSARTAGFVMLGVGGIGAAAVGGHHLRSFVNSRKFTADDGKYRDAGYACNDLDGTAQRDCEESALRVPETLRDTDTANDGQYGRFLALGYGVSGLVAITGGVLIALNPKEARRAVLFPVVGPDMAGAGFSFEF